jgi:hypothetical protein
VVVPNILRLEWVFVSFDIANAAYRTNRFIAFSATFIFYFGIQFGQLRLLSELDCLIGS